MKNKYTYLSKNVILFALGSFVPKLLSFVLVPVYTNCLSAAEYGISDLISTTISLLLPILTVDIQDAVMRFAYDEAYQKEDVFSSAFKIILAGTGLLVIASVVVSRLEITGLRDGYLVYFVIMYFLSALHNSITLFCRGIEQVKVLAVSGILQSVVTLAGNVLFLVVFRWGLSGYFIASVLGLAASILYSIIAAKLYRYIRWKTPAHVLKEMVHFSFPLIFNVIAWWINNTSDRYILSWISGLAVSGVYAVAYKIPTILSMFQSVFMQAWSISAIKEFDKDDSDGFVGNMYTFMNFMMVAACSGIMILNIPIAEIIYANEYFEAWKYVPPLLISVVFNAMSLFIGSIFVAVKDTRSLSVSTLVGALVNTICNFLFIALWSAWGAALATMIGYAVAFAMRHICLRKHICIKSRWLRDIAVYSILVVQMIVAIFGIRMIWFQVLLFFCILMLYWKEAIKLLKLALEKIGKP